MSNLIGKGRAMFLLFIISIILLFSQAAFAQKSGAFYWGDSDGNGIIEIPDLSVLASVLGNPLADDTLVYQGHPQSRFRQDLDGNGLIEVPDYSILLGWVTGDFSYRPGNPDQLALDGDTHFNLNLGDSVTLSAYALSPAAAGANLRTGLGVIFKIDPSSTCTTAQIFGYDVEGGATVNTWRSNAAYHYTMKPDEPENGFASVRVNTNGCSGNQNIKIEAFIPDDGEAGVVPGRFPSKLTASQKFSISIKPVHDYWVESTVLRNLPNSRSLHTSVWTGTEMIIWGGGYEEGIVICNTGSRYNPVTDTWKATSTLYAPEKRSYHTAVWTGTEMIVWGGKNQSYPSINTGGRYNPMTDSWSAITTTNAPAARLYHTAVWTGTEMIVWGGSEDSSGPFPYDTGGIYNPITDSWTTTSNTDAPLARKGHSAVWTGTKMIVWGGGYNTGGRYDPSTDSWSATNTGNAPAARYTSIAVWTGTVMIVWGGYDGSFYLNTGGRYNPETDSWTDTIITNAPSERCYHTAVWTGNEMIIWGGVGSSGAKNDGSRYNPLVNSWNSITTTNAPSERYYHTAVWTGTEMIVWGGQNWNYFNTGGRYNPASNSWTPTSTLGTPGARLKHTAVWTGNEMIVWGGFIGSYLSDEVYNTGGILNSAEDSWTATATTSAPSRRAWHTAVWTGTEMIVWGGSDWGIDPVGDFNDGGRYNPVTDSWIATSTTNAPEMRCQHTAVWAGNKMIVWGGYFWSSLNTGGRYDPSTNSWSETTITNAPSGRDSHTAIWTGTEMIVWGGSPYTNTGGRYNPLTDSWAATAIANAPSVRTNHSAVWTGTMMIVWGGFNGSSYLGTGGRYDPITNSWNSTTANNAPIEREKHTAVWTGTEMIVWGGYYYSAGYQYLNAGGKYNPNTDSWIATSNVNAPEERDSHTALWTGTEMIVWGGKNSFEVYGYSNGGRYVP